MVADSPHRSRRQQQFQRQSAGIWQGVGRPMISTEPVLLRLAVQLEQAPPAVVRRPADGARGRLIPPTVVANTGSRRRRRTGRPGRHKRLPPDPT